MTLRSVVAAIVVALSLVGCTQQGGPGTKQTVGALGGAALGGLLGAQFGSGTGQLAATAAGVVLGGLIGSEIGRSMDEVDRMRMNQANQQAQSAPLGQPIAWNNPDTGNSGQVVATRDGTAANGQYCREFQQTVTVSGRTETAYGVACRQADGTWRVDQQ